MTYRELLSDRFQFGRDTYGEGSHAIQKGLPRIVEELRDGTETGADADLHFVLCLLAYAHLGYPCSFDTRNILDLGVALSLHFIRGEWVKARPDLAPTIDKQPGNPQLEWFDTFRQGFLVALLSDRDAELRELADWPEAWMESDPCPIPAYHVDPLYAKLYLVVANEFRTTSFTDPEDLRSLLRGTRKKELQLLYGTWEAVLAQDPAAFERGIAASVQEWERSYDGICAHPKNCIAEPASVILAAGRRLGMEQPALEPKFAARLLTRESIRPGTCHLDLRSADGPHVGASRQDPLRRLLQDFGIGPRDD